MADNKMDIDPSGDPDRADLSDPAASFILSDQICKRRIRSHCQTYDQIYKDTNQCHTASNGR